jgi:hypothetical protein
MLVTYGLRSPEWQEVDLQVARKLQDSGRARAGTPVRLRIDTTELGAAEGWHVTLVNSEGASVWSGDVAGSDRVITAAPGKLTAGTYWVRIAKVPNRELLREFSLLVE